MTLRLADGKLERLEKPGTIARAKRWRTPAHAIRAQVYTGQYEFLDTVMLLKVDHEVAPKEQALGRGNGCADCHFEDQIEWNALGWTKDPAEGGTQTLP